MADNGGRGEESGRRRWRHFAVALGVACVLAATAKLCCFTVGTGDYALVTEFGKPVQVVMTAGLRFKLPYQSVRTFDSRLFVYTPAASEFLTVEKTPVVAAGTILWRIANPEKYFQTVFDRNGAESRLGDILFAELGAAIGRNRLAAFFSMEPESFKSEAILAEVSRKCREIALRDFGIGVNAVLLRSFDFPKQNRPPLYSRMKSERGRLSMKFRSEGEEEGLKVRAAADQEKSRILSEALKQAQQTRGEGEGRAARIYAESLAKGPDFYAFVRTMQASRNLVPKGTTLMLPADSELFGLLQDRSHYDRTGANRKTGARRNK